ncbi:UvrD-helicase domain-containing protein [Kutzneria sp. NPDC051319]|uniref:UvrD-helicase domain-containing protein n=1 Tax=Kutzneria sp. NPDC051319 TaxID=3155047 RepID=UPI0034444104
MARDALLEVTTAIDERASFLVEAGAGSGKTFALVHGLKHILSRTRDELERGGKRVVCITYTNVAKNEIRERIADDPLVFVGTIHEFLWDVIEPHQAELKHQLVARNEKAENPVENLAGFLEKVPITYSDRGRYLAAGRIFHDDVLELAEAMFISRPKLARLSADKFPFLFIDEYQDTTKGTVRLVLDHFMGRGSTGAVVGFFGDSMQKIYPRGIGRVEHAGLRVIPKHENYRCSRRVIEVLNKMRPGLPQEAAGSNVEGEVYFFSGEGEPAGNGRLDRARQMLAAKGWDEANTKILFLTHRWLAEAQHYPALLKAFAKAGSFGRDRLMEGNDPVAQTLARVEQLGSAFVARDNGALLALLARSLVRVVRHSDKIRLSAKLDRLVSLCERGTIGEVLDYAFAANLVGESDSMRRMEERAVAAEDDRGVRDREFLAAVREVSYQEFAAFAAFRDERTPFSTQHGVKGAEFPNVIVAIEDSSWTQYNMGNLLAGHDNRSADRYERSRNLFYVCCSRPQSGLAVVFLSDPPEAALDTARDWFGAENML